MITIQDQIDIGASVTTVGNAVPAGMQRKFTAFGAHNDSGSAVILKVYLVPTSGSAANPNLLINRAVPAGKTDTCPELMGRGLNSGGTLQVEGAGLNVGWTAIDTIIG